VSVQQADSTAAMSRSSKVRTRTRAVYRPGWSDQVSPAGRNKYWDWGDLRVIEAMALPTHHPPYTTQARTDRAPEEPGRT